MATTVDMASALIRVRVVTVEVGNHPVRERRIEMAQCEVCGNEYDKSFEAHLAHSNVCHGPIESPPPRLHQLGETVKVSVGTGAVVSGVANSTLSVCWSIDKAMP